MKLIAIVLVIVLALGVALVTPGLTETEAQGTLPTLPDVPTPEPTTVWAATALSEIRQWRADVNAAATATAAATPVREPWYATQVALSPTISAYWATFTAPTPEPTPFIPTPARPCGVGYIVDLNNDSADVIAILPYDAFCQRLSLYTAHLVVQYRGTQGYGTLADLMRVPGFTPEMIEAIRACACTMQD